MHAPSTIHLKETKSSQSYQSLATAQKGRQHFDSHVKITLQSDVILCVRSAPPGRLKLAPQKIAPAHHSSAQGTWNRVKLTGRAERNDLTDKSVHIRITSALNVRGQFRHMACDVAKLVNCITETLISTSPKILRWETQQPKRILSSNPRSIKHFFFHESTTVNMHTPVWRINYGRCVHVCNHSSTRDKTQPIDLDQQPSCIRECTVKHGPASRFRSSVQ